MFLRSFLTALYLFIFNGILVSSIPLGKKSNTEPSDVNSTEMVEFSVVPGRIFGSEFKSDIASRRMTEVARIETIQAFRIIHFCSGKRIPGITREFKESYYRLNSRRFLNDNWIPQMFIIFGNTIPMNLCKSSHSYHFLTVSSRADHLRIYCEYSSGKNSRLRIVYCEPDDDYYTTNGFIFPPIFGLYEDIGIYFVPVVYKRFIISTLVEKSRLSKQVNILGYTESVYTPAEMKLAIVICGDDQRNQVKAWDRASSVISFLRNLPGGSSMQICLAAQPDTLERKNTFVTRYPENDIILYFFGEGISTSIFVVKTNDEQQLRLDLLEWKRNLQFLKTDQQTIAFHFTTINDFEPENSEKIFSEIFVDVPLSTLNLLGHLSRTGGSKNATEPFIAGPVYAIVTFRNFEQFENAI